MGSWTQLVVALAAAACWGSVPPILEGDGGSSGGVGDVVVEGGAPPSFPVMSSSGVAGSETGEWDPCPSDTYVFDLDDGTTYVIEVQVFCDPRPWIDPGYPLPGEGDVPEAAGEVQ